FDRTPAWHVDAERGPSTPSLDHLVGDGEHARRDGVTERLSSLHVDDQLEFGRLQYRQVGRLLALEDAAGVESCLTKRIGIVWAVAHESAGRYELAPNIRDRHPVAGRQRDELGAPIVKKWVGGND